MKKVLLTLLVAIFATAVLAQQTKTEIKPASLPKCVLDYIKANYKDFKIEQAFKMDLKVQGKIVTAYNVCLLKGNDKVWLTFDQNCKAKKINKDEFEGNAPPKQTPPVKPKENQPPTETGDAPKK